MNDSNVVADSGDITSHTYSSTVNYYHVSHTVNVSSVTDSSRSGMPTPEFSVWQAVLIGIFLSTIIIISIGGNVLVCVAILTDRKLKKVSNMFLISLAIADLVVSSLVMPFAVANDILGYWPFEPGFCAVWMSFDILSATASILNLCAISLDRYVHMKSPFHYEEWMTYRKCLIFIALIWLASLLISFLPINLGWHEQGVQSASEASNHTTTTMTSVQLVPFCYLELNPLYAVISSSISFYIPCIVMVAIYTQIYKLARYHAKSIKKIQSFDHMTAAGGTKKKIAENKALFTLGMIMGLFLLSWIPFFIVNLVSAFCNGECVPGKVFVAFTWLGYCNSTMNPIIYSKFNADFRQAFKRILCCQRCRNTDPYKKTGSAYFSRTGTVVSKKTSNGHLSNDRNHEDNDFMNNNGIEEKELVVLNQFTECRDSTSECLLQASTNEQ